MTDLLTVICYTVAAFGVCNVVAFGSGPFRIFEYIRYWASLVGPHFGQLFTCMMCLPANFGWMFSLLDWFIIPVEVTPFNVVLGGQEGMWWLALLLDGAYTTAAVYLMYVADDYIEKKTEYIDRETGNYVAEGFDPSEQVVDDITEERNGKND